MRKKNLRIAYVSILILELLISGYLLFRQFTLLQSTNQSVDICQSLSLGTCDNILKANDLILGLPWSAWGVLYFSFLLIFFGLANFIHDFFKKEASVISVVLVFFTNILSIVLLAGIVLGYYPFCGLCVIVHILQFFLFYLVWETYDISLKEVFTGIKAFFAYLLFGKSVENSRVKVIAFLMLIFVFITLYQRLSFEIKIQNYYAQINQISDNTSENFFASQPQETLISELDASIGEVNAPIQILIFSDFECPYCAEFAKECQKWLAKYPNKVRLIFKHYPLSSTCNPVMEDDMHPNACEMAKFAQSALLQRKFWEFHDFFFEEGFNEEKINQLVKELKIDLKILEEGKESLAIKAKIKADIELANRLGVSGTPSVFINNRKVENVHPDIIEQIIERALK